MLAPWRGARRGNSEQAEPIAQVGWVMLTCISCREQDRWDSRILCLEPLGPPCQQENSWVGRREHQEQHHKPQLLSCLGFGGFFCCYCSFGFGFFFNLLNLVLERSTEKSPLQDSQECYRHLQKAFVFPCPALSAESCSELPQGLCNLL